MKLHPAIRIVLLVACMQAVSAYQFRCWLFCGDQTAVQNDYVGARDKCRKYAQLRIETDTSSTELREERARAQKLISLFSSCMADNGWTIPDGKGGQQAAGSAPVQAAANPTNDAATLAAQRREKAYLARSSECAFARHGAAYSSISRTRAEACDIECAEQRKATPGASRPAACPSEGK